MAQSSGGNKTAAVIGYFTIIGWIIGLLMHNSNKSELSAFHLRQFLGLFILGVMSNGVFQILGAVGLPASVVLSLGAIVSLVLFVFWILGLVSAIQGTTKPMPLVGAFFNSRLTFIQ